MRLAASAGAAGSGPDRLRRGTRQDLRGGSEVLRPRTGRLGRGVAGRGRRSAGRRRRGRRAPWVARAAPPASGPSSSPGPRPPPAARRRSSIRQDPPPASTSSRSGGATGASPGGPMSSADVARANPFHAPASRRGPLGAEDLHGARETPVAPRHPRRHQPAREP